MRSSRTSAPRLVRVLATLALLCATGCVASEASPAAQAQNKQQLKLMRGYNCTQAAIAGRYSCARTRDLWLQRGASSGPGPFCANCGTAASH